MNQQPYAVWLDIPVNDLPRAIKFYGRLLKISLKEEHFDNMSMAVFPHKDGDLGACLYKGTDNRPSENGITVYFGVEGRLDQAIDIAIKDGGTVIQPRHKIGPHGYRAVILDSEGNRIVLHSMT